MEKFNKFKTHSIRMSKTIVYYYKFPNINIAIREYKEKIKYEFVLFSENDSGCYREIGYFTEKELIDWMNKNCVCVKRVHRFI